MPSAMFEWDGESMIPIAVHRNRCDDQFVVHQRYHMEAIEPRSMKTHNHHFAMIGDMWASLPERYGMEPWAQSAEHLRKYALISTGYCNTQVFTCGSKAEARRWASNLRPMDEFSVVWVKETTVHVFTAMSQSMKAMGKADFQASKEAVLNHIQGLLDPMSEPDRISA